MPQILFASNNVTHFPGAVAGSDVNTFDATRVPYGLQVSNFQLISSPDFAPSDGTDTWFHFRSFSNSGGLSTPVDSTGTLFVCQDALGRNIARISKLSSNWLQMPVITVFNGTTSVNVTGILPFTKGRINFVDVRVTVNLTLIRVELYVNGSLSGSAQFGSNPNGIGNPIRFTLGPAYAENLANTHVFSEILVANGDTRNARLNFLRPAATGAFSEWDGTIASLGDDDAATGIYTKVANERHTMSLSAYTGAQNLSNLVSVSMTTRGLNSPSKIKHVIRQSGVNYDGPDIPLPNGLKYNIHDLPLNPATSLPWTSSDLSSIEVGVLSVA